MKVYVGVNSEKGHVIPEVHAYEYALAEIDKDPALKAELVAWFFSGDFIEEEVEDVFID